jgi:hypothetical protein
MINLPLVKLDIANVIRSSSLGEESIGKWCFVVAGCFFGFFESKEEAINFANDKSK